jgi:general stress protein 26
MDKGDKADRVWDILEKHGVGMLTTRFSGGLRARPLEARPDREAGIIYFVTDVRGLKDDEIATDPTVGFVVVDEKENAYLSVSGHAEVMRDPETRYLHPAVRAMWERNDPAKGPDYGRSLARKSRPLEQRIAGRLYQAGVRLLLGTDASATGLFPGRSAHEELRELVQVGLPPLAALQAGTAHAGDFMAEHLPGTERFGRIAPGYRADLVLLDGNPLQDIGAMAAIRGVMARGHWLSRDLLARRRDALARQYAAERP